MRARGFAANTGFSQALRASVEERSPPTHESHSRGFSLRAYATALDAPRSRPLAGRISRLHTRDRYAGARHAVRNPCYTPKGLPIVVCVFTKKKSSHTRVAWVAAKEGLLAALADDLRDDLVQRGC